MLCDKLTCYPNNNTQPIEQCSNFTPVNRVPKNLTKNLTKNSCSNMTSQALISIEEFMQTETGNEDLHNSISRFYLREARHNSSS
jgi:hypothetical protein